MKVVMIKDDAEAKALAEKHGVAEKMMTQAAKKLPDAIKGGVGFVITSRVGYLEADGITILMFSLFTNFVEGENGWSAFGWTGLNMGEELADAAHKILEMEKL